MPTQHQINEAIAADAQVVNAAKVASEAKTALIAAEEALQKARGIAGKRHAARLSAAEKRAEADRLEAEYKATFDDEFAGMP